MIPSFFSVGLLLGQRFSPSLACPFNSSVALVVIIGLSDSLQTLRRSSHFKPGSWRLRSGGTHYPSTGPTECVGMAGSFSSSKQHVKGLITVVAFYRGSGDSAPFPMGLVTGVSVFQRQNSQHYLAPSPHW